MDKWPEDRMKELDTLLCILHDASSLNRGANAVEKIVAIMRRAKKLRNSDLTSGRQSFQQYLIGKAHGE